MGQGVGRANLMRFYSHFQFKGLPVDREAEATPLQMLLSDFFCRFDCYISPFVSAPQRDDRYPGSRKPRPLAVDECANFWPGCRPPVCWSGATPACRNALRRAGTGFALGAPQIVPCFVDLGTQLT